MRLILVKTLYRLGVVNATTPDRWTTTTRFSLNSSATSALLPCFLVVSSHELTSNYRYSIRFAEFHLLILFF